MFKIESDFHIKMTEYSVISSIFNDQVKTKMTVDSHIATNLRDEASLILTLVYISIWVCVAYVSKFCALNFAKLMNFKVQIVSKSPKLI